MKREIITTDSYGRITIPSDTGNIWMNEMELVELFGVIAPTLRPPSVPCTSVEF